MTRSIEVITLGFALGDCSWESFPCRAFGFETCISATRIIYFFVEHLHKIKSSKSDSVWKKLVKFKPKETVCKSHCLSIASCEFAGRRGLEFLSFCNRNRLGALIFVVTHCLIMNPWRLDPFEALVEIFDFAAGLVQRVPKKPNEMKADLQNSTASQGDCSCVVFNIFL